MSFSAAVLGRRSQGIGVVGGGGISGPFKLQYSFPGGRWRRGPGLRCCWTLCLPYPGSRPGSLLSPRRALGGRLDGSALGVLTLTPSQMGLHPPTPLPLLVPAQQPGRPALGAPLRCPDLPLGHVQAHSASPAVGLPAPVSPLPLRAQQPRSVLRGPLTGAAWRALTQARRRAPPVHARAIPLVQRFSAFRSATL